MGVVREAFGLDPREPCQVGEIRGRLAAASSQRSPRERAGAAGAGFMGSRGGPCLKMRLLF